MSSTTQSVQCFGKKKTATAVAHTKVRPTLTTDSTDTIRTRYHENAVESLSKNSMS